MITIELQHLRFRAFHGVYEEEKILGNDFEVDVLVHYDAHQEVIRHLGDTINYESIFAIVKKRMEKSTPLLETLVTDMAAQIGNAFFKVQSVQVKVAKLCPPIQGYQGSVAVSCEWHR
jgi:7,8-dihydroneopterin aldolase/epimerase/oxygenase